MFKCNNCGAEFEQPDKQYLSKKDRCPECLSKSVFEVTDAKKIVEDHALSLVPLIMECRKIDPNVALDGDEVDELVFWISQWINLHEGNITTEEFDQAIYTPGR